MENSLVSIDFTKDNEPIVSARELHEKLEISKDFTSWFKQQCERLGFIEREDFTPFWGESTGGRPGVDYFVTIYAAKELCMASGGKNAKAIRLYFIEVEKAWNSPEQVIARALLMSHAMVQQKQEEIERLLPKAEMHDMFLSAPNAQAMGVVAKALGVGRNRLFQMMRNQRIFMNNNLPYQQFIERGYFRVIEKPIAIGQQTINKPQTLVTPKGVDWLGKIIRNNDWAIEQ